MFHQQTNHPPAKKPSLGLVFGRRADRTCFFLLWQLSSPRRVCLKDKAWMRETRALESDWMRETRALESDWMRETRALERRLKPCHRQLMNLP